jgi:ribonuclease HI
MNGNTTSEELQQSNNRLAKKSKVGQLFLYTDGSLQKGVGGWAVVVEGQQNSWGVVPEQITISGSTTTELFAIQQALVRIASSRSWEKPLAITIFSDSAEAIKFSLGLHSPSSGSSDSSLCDSITLKLDELELSHSVTLKWLKAHAGIEGNELADQLADLAVRTFLQRKEGVKLQLL